MKHPRLMLLLAAIALSISVAQASTIYQYKGNPFDQQQGTYGWLFKEIDISLTFDQQLQPSSVYSYGSGLPGATLLTWQIDDGVLSVGPAAADLLFQCDLDTDEFGRILFWSVAAQTTDTTGALLTESSNPFYDVAAVSYTANAEEDFAGFIFMAPGTWSQHTSAPEPGSFALVLGALAVGAGLLGRRVRT